MINIVCFDIILFVKFLFRRLFWLCQSINFSFFYFVVNIRSVSILNLAARIVLSIIEYLWLLTVLNVDLFILGKLFLIGLVLIYLILCAGLLLIYFFGKLVLSLIEVNCLLSSFLLILIWFCILRCGIFNFLFLILVLFYDLCIHSKNFKQLLLCFRFCK